MSKRLKGMRSTFILWVIPQLMRDKNQREGEKQWGISNAKDGEWNRSRARRRRGLMYHTTAIQFTVTSTLQINTHRAHQSSPQECAALLSPLKLTSSCHSSVSKSTKCMWAHLTVTKCRVRMTALRWGVRKSGCEKVKCQRSKKNASIGS